MDINTTIHKFPLYDSLKNEKSDLEWEDVCINLEQLSKEHAEIIYALIFHHFLLEYKSLAKKPTLKQKTYKFPYESKSPGSSSSKGILLYSSKLPDDLKKIITVYISKICYT
jgi:hypothetical protein